MKKPCRLLAVCSPVSGLLRARPSYGGTEGNPRIFDKDELTFTRIRYAGAMFCVMTH